MAKLTFGTMRECAHHYLAFREPRIPALAEDPRLPLGASDQRY
jgi:hypothetical protein